MDNYRDVLSIAQIAIGEMIIGKELKNIYDMELNKLKTDNEKVSLINLVWPEINKIYKGNDKKLAQYPALLTSIVLIEKKYDALKDIDPSILAILAYSTYYIGLENISDVVTLFKDGVIINKLMAKFQNENICENSKNYYIMETMNYIFNRFNDKERGINYLDNSTVTQLKNIMLNPELNEDSIMMIMGDKVIQKKKEASKIAV